jgi:hypothetical protein
MSEKSAAAVKAEAKPSLNSDKSGLLQRKCDCGNAAGLTGECSQCDREKLAVQRQSKDGSDVGEVPAIVHEVLRSPGQPLDRDTRIFMESRFGHDFSQVRVRTDEKAAQSARAVNALAYTVGDDIIFGSRQYAPKTAAGQQLLAHELVHTVQQGHVLYSGQDKLKIGKQFDNLEREADTFAEEIFKNEDRGSYGGSQIELTLQKQSDEIDVDLEFVSPQETESLSNQGITLPTASRPVFFCSKSVALGGKHAFFRLGGSEPGNSTFELEHDEYGEHCPCGIQGLPTRDYPEDRDATDSPCVAAPSITEACLINNWATYPVGKYCALGPNSNTYARFLAERCGGRGLRPPGWLPGFDDSPPPVDTANPAMDARITFLPGACQTISCKDDICHQYGF